MKIAMFTDSYYPAVDGVVNAVSTVSRELERLGHEVFIFAPRPTDGHEIKDITKGGTFFFNAFRFKYYPQYRSAFLPSNKNRILRSLGVDMIHTHGIAFMGMKGLSAAKHFHMPVTTTYHTNVHEAADYYNPLPIPASIISNLTVRYMRFFLNRSDAVIAPTRPILEELVRIAPRMPYTAVIPAGVDIRRFRPSARSSAVRDEYGISDAPLLLYLGRVAHEKNIDALIKAMTLLKDRTIKLMIVGEGPAKRDLEKLAHSLHLDGRVIFTGFVSDGRLPEFYCSADAFVSASKFETQGISILEALACGCPVASINFRAVTDFVIDDFNGFLFDDNLLSIAETMEKAIGAGQSVRQNARRTAERYSKENSARALSDLYTRIMDLHSSGR